MGMGVVVEAPVVMGAVVEVPVVMGAVAEALEAMGAAVVMEVAGEYSAGEH